ncbi:vacuolar serine protease [Mycena vitilis]|nr:vacuolar serine protease [Mycena vitilis]
MDQDEKTHVHPSSRLEILKVSRESAAEKVSFRTYGKYHYDPRESLGVDVYAVDSGVNIHHGEFEGRASLGTSGVNDDANGHAHAPVMAHRTHCAGTVASRKYGVAKCGHRIAVKVMGADGTRSLSDTIARIAAVHVVVAAGNDNGDARKSTPGSAGQAIVVGASTQTDARAYFSNHGASVDVFPPGLNVLSTYKGGPSSTATMSGTSMAPPHAAGLVAYLLGVYPSPIRPMKAALIELAMRGTLTGLPGDTANLLIFNNATTTASS